jgi:3-hydroxybutyryl-CoA dehydrogenase
MGAGIAAQAIVVGAAVRVVEASAQAAAAGAARIEAQLARAIEHGAEPEGFGPWGIGVEMDAVRDATLVVESVPESVELKRAVLAAASKAAPPAALIATNTSSIQVADLAPSVLGAHRFGGLHFFNPVLASALIEVVAGDQTAPSVVDDLVAAARALGKEAIVVRDRPGFATSRLGVALGLEAIRMVEEGVASVEDIDRGMQLGYRHPMGPLRLTDLIGLDVRLGIARYLAQRLGPRFEPPGLLVEMVGRGELGRKSGRGFYTW